MGRKFSFTSLLSSRVAGDTKPSSSSSTWPLPSCSQLPKTLSSAGDTSKSSAAAFDESEDDDTAAEAVLQGLRSDRLFFDPGCVNTRSIMVEAGEGVAAGFEGGVAVAVESTDPHSDFRASMEEMVEVEGAADWAWLQEMLVWFLRSNSKGTHGFIIGAFLDLLMGLAASSSSFSSSAPNDNPLCSSCSSNSSYTFEIEEVEDEENSGNG